MKECSKCKLPKELTEFHKDRRHKDGLRYNCKACAKVYDKAHYEANKDDIAQTQKAYKEANKEKLKARKKAHHEAHKDKYSAYEAKRRAAKLQATPHWLTEYQYKQIELKYWVSNFLTEYTGIQHHVDHIHPLQGKNICGLHVPNNLQVLTAEENLNKNNSHEASSFSEMFR